MPSMPKKIAPTMAMGRTKPGFQREMIPAVPMARLATPSSRTISRASSVFNVEALCFDVQLGLQQVVADRATKRRMPAASEDEPFAEQCGQCGSEAPPRNEVFHGWSSIAGELGKHNRQQ